MKKFLIIALAALMCAAVTACNPKQEDKETEKPTSAATDAIDKDEGELPIMTEAKDKTSDQQDKSAEKKDSSSSKKDDKSGEKDASGSNPTDAASKTDPTQKAESGNGSSGSGKTDETVKGEDSTEFSGEDGYELPFVPA